MNRHSNPKIREPFTTRGCMIVIVETYIPEAVARRQCWNLQNRSKSRKSKASKRITTTNAKSNKYGSLAGIRTHLIGSHSKPIRTNVNSKHKCHTTHATQIAQSRL